MIVVHLFQELLKEGHNKRLWNHILIEMLDQIKKHFNFSFMIESETNFHYIQHGPSNRRSILNYRKNLTEIKTTQISFSIKKDFQNLNFWVVIVKLSSFF